MIELPDDELDKLFRKSSEELDPTYEPDDWNDLRKRLDQQDGRTPAGWWRKWWPAGLLALLIPIGMVLYSWEGEKGGKGEGRKEKSGIVGESGVVGNEGTEDGGSESGGVEDGGVKAAGDEASIVGESGVVKESGVVGKSADARGDNGTPVVDNGNRLADSGNKIAGNGKKDIDSKLKASEKDTGKSSSKSELNAAVGNNGRKPLPRSRSKAGGVYLEPNRSTVGGGDGALSINRGETSPAEPAAQAAESNAENADAEPARTLISAAELNIKALKWNTLPLPGVSEPVYELPEAVAPAKPSRSEEDQPLWAVRFGYSPDLSTVGLKNFSKPGTAVSLLVEYSIMRRLFVQSGVVWSRKDYYASAEAYELPKIPHYYPPEMTGVDGICRVLEVPLNLRYDFASGERSRWFASGGFSSYHMNSEKYKYYFVDENDPNIKYRNWKGKTGWYWLSHANVSAGYEYRISRKLSLLAEPSIRMPLKRVGYGKVNLITTGLWLSVRYTPVFK